ncbi:hypothetical protein Tco_0907133 [Tanacetum coccineum]|uniref:Uncharacterized protein n=1 Tax=Tanacetum coccineum TaxID=301880 RepID=A0ABQ5CJC2_9ASTR
MAESSSQNPSSPKITPKEEPVTLNKPESPNPFLPASQVEDSSLDQISIRDATILYWSTPMESRWIMQEYYGEDLIHKLNKKTREKISSPEPPFTDHMKAICNLDVPVDSKAPKSSSQTEEVPQGKKPRAKSGLKRKRSSKYTSESTTKASKS